MSRAPGGSLRPRPQAEAAEQEQRALGQRAARGEEPELDGRVRRARGFFDLYDAAVQLGMLPARGSLAETALLLFRGFGLRPRA